MFVYAQLIFIDPPAPPPPTDTCIRSKIMDPPTWAHSHQNEILI